MSGPPTNPGLSEPILRYFIREGRLVRSEEHSVPIDERTLARHRLLHIVDPSCGETWEDAIAYLGRDYDAEDDLEHIAEPPWKDYSDLNFAQVLFGESQCGYFGPWGEMNKPDDLVGSREEFMKAVLEWIGPEDGAEEAERKRCEEERPIWLAVAEAALALDARKVHDLSHPIIKKWNKGFDNDS